jgi:hypothetical protein
MRFWISLINVATVPEAILESPVEDDINQILLQHTGSPATCHDIVQVRIDGIGPRAHGPLPLTALEEMADLFERGLPRENYFLLREIGTVCLSMAEGSSILTLFFISPISSIPSRSSRQSRPHK